MIFGIVMFLLVAGIAYFHFAQGFFSSTLSAVISMISVCVAFGTFEQLGSALAQGKLADQTAAVCLCVLYGGTYILLRVAFDKLVPGNVNFGSLPDKIGGAAMGVLVGLITAGTVAVAAQTMPFGPSVIGYERWATKTSKVEIGSVPAWTRVGARGENIADLLVKHDELVKPRLDPAEMSKMFPLPADDFVVGLVRTLSAGGLAGETKWADVNPDYLTALFAQRIGLQPQAKITAFPLNKQPKLEVVQDSIWLGDEKGYPQMDGDIADYRTNKDEADKTLVAGEGQRLLIVRVKINADAAETDGKVRFSLSSFRLVAGGKQFFPVALKRGDEAVHQRADDFLIMEGDRGVDLIFSVDPAAVFGAETDVKSEELKVGAGTFLEFKRLSRVEIGGKAVFKPGEYEADEKFGDSVLRRIGWPPGVKK